MNDVVSPRAQLVELLWQLKQGFDQHGDNQLRFVHFNTLLNDPAYRVEIIERAVNSPHAKLRRLGKELKQLNRDGALLRKQHAATTRPSALLNPDIAETLGKHNNRQRPSRYRPLLLLAALLVCTVATYYGYAPLSQWLAGERHVTGSLTGHHHWDAGTTWILDDIVYVEAGASLTIEAGTTIQGRSGSALVITRDATLFARGHPQTPIVFTSSQPVGTRAAGDWGGLVLLGDAPVNLPNPHIEGIPADDSRGAFGGQHPDNSCGVLEYARIEFAGFEVYANNELNGLTLGGCGRNSIVRHLQVHRALDDGIEVFGGTVDLKHILITGAGDDSLDWDLGWRGRVQFLIAQQYANVGDNAFEGDNQKGNPRARPVSEPVMHNLTLVSPRSHERFHRAMTLRRGSGGHFNNMIISGFSGEAIDFKGDDTIEHLARGNLTANSLILFENGTHGLTHFAEETLDKDDDNGFDEGRYFRQPSRGARFDSDPRLGKNIDSQSHPDFTPSTRSPARHGASPIPQEEFWDEAANYLGAVRPGATHTWLDNWTDYPLN